MTETLEDFFYILLLYLNYLHSEKAAGMYVRVWEGLRKQEGASGKVVAFSCPSFVLCLKCRLGPVGGKAEGGECMA